MKMTSVESKLQTLYLNYLRREVELIEKPLPLTEDEQRELDELKLITARLEPLVDELAFEMKLRDDGYVGKLADYET